ncbi:MAG: hypothetical protein HJJLKODD_00104 [Phycisphaerae bacterium]|nr:hypothetical protein [Phycisphaerae bacterium]
MRREIVEIDEALCDGCGQCVPSCAEGAIRIVDGKARLMADRLCDGMGACLGHCPQGAIRIIRREAEEFSEAAVHAQQHPQPVMQMAHAHHHDAGGCPGGRFQQFNLPVIAAQPVVGAQGTDGMRSSSHDSGQPSQLQHWPVQLHLLPAQAPVLSGARLLICADCVPVAFGDFQRELLKERAVVIACPKLDETGGYVNKLTQIMRLNELVEIVVAIMEVPCCSGLWRMVQEAYQRSGCQAPLRQVVISTRGEWISRH